MGCLLEVMVLDDLLPVVLLPDLNRTSDAITNDLNTTVERRHLLPGDVKLGLKTAPEDLDERGIVGEDQAIVNMSGNVDKAV